MSDKKRDLSLERVFYWVGQIANLPYERITCPQYSHLSMPSSRVPPQFGLALYNCDMLHRHLAHQEFTLAAIDNVIARGRRQDWVDLRRAVLADRAMLKKVLRVCQAHTADPYAQRYHFWKQYAERNLA